jgi:hypothetical protein
VLPHLGFPLITCLKYSPPKCYKVQATRWMGKMYHRCGEVLDGSFRHRASSAITGWKEVLNMSPHFSSDGIKTGDESMVYASVTLVIMWRSKGFQLC